MACTSSAYMLLSTVKPLSPEVHKWIEMIKISKSHKLEVQIREMMRDNAKPKKRKLKIQFQLLPTIYEE